MKKLSLNLILGLAALLVSTTANAQSNDDLDEIRDLCTDILVTASQTKASANQVIVFSENGNTKQLDRAVDSTGDGLDDVIVQLRRLRRITAGIITNQYQVQTTSYGNRSSLSRDYLDETSGFPAELAEVAEDIKPLTGLIRNLAQDIRAEVMAMKNSSN